MKLGAKLKTLIALRRLSQEEVAARVGFSQAQVNKWCNDKNTPDVFQALDLARALDVPLEYLADEAMVDPPLPPTREERDLLAMIRDIGVVEAAARLSTPRGSAAVSGTPAQPRR